MPVSPALRNSLLLGGIILIVLIALFVGYPRTQVELPKGEQVLTGVLKPVAISVKRRGSHLFLQNGVEKYYVEGGSIDLRSFEGIDVVVTGTVEKNTDPKAYPVLLATKIELIDVPVKTHTIDVLHVSVDTPLAWNAQMFPDGVRFSQTGATQASLAIHLSPLATLPEGEKTTVGGRAAVRLIENAIHMAYVQNGHEMIVFSFKPLDGSPLDVAERDFTRLLRSVHFVNSSSSAKTSSGTVTHGSGTVINPSSESGKPCGGPAGVLCPTGETCIITESDGIGHCRIRKR